MAQLLPSYSPDSGLLPLLPLRDVVVYPHLVIPLFVGRTKSVKALELASEGNKQILLVAQKSASKDDPEASDLHEVGTIATVLQMLKLPDGTVKVLVDEDGVGGGVVDELKCKGFKNGSSPTNKMYFNLKSQCGYKLAEQIKYMHIDCDLPDSEIEMIRQELGMLKTYESDKDGKLRILPKEKIKEVLGRSPDWLDVFIMRMYFELGIKESSPMVGFRSIG